MLLLPSICCMPSSLLLLLIRFGVFGCAAFSLNLILSSFKAPKSWDKTNRIKSSRKALSIPLIEIRKKNALFSKIDKFISWASFRNNLPNVNGYKVRTRPSHPECLSFSRLNDNNTSTMPVHVFLVPLLLLWARLYKYFLANVPIKQKLGNWFLEKLNCFLCDGNIDGQLFSKSAKRTLVRVHRTCSSVFHVHFEQDLVHPKKLLGIFP